MLIFSNVIFAIITISVILFSLILIFLGIFGLIYKETFFPGNIMAVFLRRTTKLYGTTLRDRNVTYQGSESKAPAIAMISLGSIVPLLILSVFIDEWFNIDYSMVILLLSNAMIAFIMILYSFYKNRQ